MSLERVLSGLGRTFIGAGVIVFLFIAYQLWGTNLAEARSQDELQDQAEEIFGDQPTVTNPTTPPAPGAPPTTSPQNTTPAPPPAPPGSAVASIKIPKINVQKYVVAGTDVGDLKKGPGHYEGTPLPGQPGNSAIAGHRTTYGAPFGDLDKLKPGDEIDVTTRQGSFVYFVTGTKIVSPSDVSVLAPTKDNRLTLTTCHPPYSAAQRMIVTAQLAPGVKAAPAPTTTVPPTTAKPAPGKTTLAPPTTPSTLAPDALATQPDLGGATVSGTSSPKGPAIRWALLTALVGFAIWMVGRMWRRWPAYILGAPLFLIVLYVFFETFALLLPANA